MMPSITLVDSGNFPQATSQILRNKRLEATPRYECEQFALPPELSEVTCRKLENLVRGKEKESSQFQPPAVPQQKVQA